MRQLLHLIILSSVVIILSCSNKISGGAWTIEKNSQIAPSVIEEIKTVETAFFKTVIEKKYNDSNLLFAESVLSNTSSMEQFYNSLNIVLKKTRASTRDDFYIKSKGTSSKSENMALIDFKENETNLSFQLDPIKLVNENLFITLQKFTDSKLEYLISFNYIKENNTWKIFGIRLGVLSVNRMNAVKWMDIANSNVDKGEVLTGFLCAEVSNLINKPALFIHYKEEKQLKESYEKILVRIQNDYKLPYVINSIKSKPEYFQIRINIEDNGSSPLIKYKSNLNIKNIALLKTEAKEIKDYFLKNNPSMKEYFKSLVFRVFTKVPLKTDIKNDYTELSVDL